MSSEAQKEKDMLKSNIYETLGVDNTANEKDIKTAYRKKALKLHPDRNPDNEAAIKLFHELQEAYDWIMEPGKTHWFFLAIFDLIF